MHGSVPIAIRRTINSPLTPSKTANLELRQRAAPLDGPSTWPPSRRPRTPLGWLAQAGRPKDLRLAGSYHAAGRMQGSLLAGSVRRLGWRWSICARAGSFIASLSSDTSAECYCA